METSRGHEGEVEEKDSTFMGGIFKRLRNIEKVLVDVSIPLEVRKDLNEALELSSRLDAYCSSRSDELSPAMQKVKDHTWSAEFGGVITREDIGEFDTHAITATGQVLLLRLLLQLKGAKTVLEVGSFTGFGALGMSEVLPADGKVTTIELNPALCKYVRHVAKTNNQNIEVINGKACEVLKTLVKEKRQYDLIYIDCAKMEYGDYHKIILEGDLLADGGILAFDNCIWKGRSILQTDEVGTYMDAFTKMIKRDQKLEKILLPCFDGLLLVQKKVIR